MKISSNITAMMIVGNMDKASKKSTTAMERLSSGMKINAAKDNPAGWAISNKLDVQSQGLNRANQNSMDAISLVQTTEGALNEIHDMLNRIRELSVQSINDSNTKSDRVNIQSEIDELISEISTISERTDFNGIKLLDSDEKVMIQTGANAYESMEISGKDTKLDDVRAILSDYSVMKNKDSETVGKIVDAIKAAEPVEDKYVSLINYALEDEITADKLTPIKKIIDNYNFDGSKPELESLLNDIKSSTSETEVKNKIMDYNNTNNSSLFNTIKGIIDGSNEKDNELVKEISDALNTTGDKINLIKDILNKPEPNEQDTLDNLLNKVDRAIENVSKIRGVLGAYQNRLEHTVANLGTSEENTIASLSRIQDADMAEEMSEYTLQNVIAQSGNAMLAQANQRPQQVLQLLNS